MELKKIDGPAAEVQPVVKHAEQEPPPWWKAKSEAIEVRRRIQQAYGEARAFQIARAKGE